jgi:hypothetical protein
MTLTMGLRYKNPDASADINLRLKDLANKGFVAGGEVTPVSGVFQVNVAPFVCINYDGAVIRSDANVVLNPGDGIVNVVFLRARYVLMGSPIMQVGIAPVGTYLIDPEFDWLTVLAIVDLTAGAPHSEVAPSEILYSWTDGTNTVNRHAVDPQGRSFYRDPVENSGVLFTPGSPYLPPLADNRNGDVRLALDTGSFYWWNEVGGLWEVFDEVPLNMHREHEHTNGITGDSDSTTLEPSISGGSTVNIAAVPSGSGYTVNGRYTTAPTPMPFAQDLAGDVKFSQRGLIQASSTQLGALSIDDGAAGDYRVKLNAGDPLSISAVRIVDLSDGHDIGSFTLLYQPGTGLSWADGEPVDVGTGTATGGTYRLYTPDYANWIDVRLDSGAVLPGGAVTDTYDVLASKKDDEHLLIAYFFWDGTTLTDVTDKRYFGNLGAQELSDEFKAGLPPTWNDLRGSMVYSGGTMSVIGGLTMRITGPLIAYVGGKRFVVPVTTGVGNNGYTGITFPGAGAPQTSFVYVNASGVLTLSATDPNTTPGLEFAEVGRVVGAAGTIITNEDRRDPQIIVGQATRTARLRWTTGDALEWTPSTKLLSVKSNGSLTGTGVEAGSLSAGSLNAPNIYINNLNSYDFDYVSVNNDLLIVGDNPKHSWQINSATGRATLAEMRAPGQPTSIYDAFYEVADGSFRQYVGTYNEGAFYWGRRTLPSTDTTWMYLHGADGLQVNLSTALNSGLSISGSPSFPRIEINASITQAYRQLAYASVSPSISNADYYTENLNTTVGPSGAHITYAWMLNGPTSSSNSDGFFADFFRQSDSAPRISINKVINNSKLPFIEVSATAATSEGGINIGAVGNEVNVTINGGFNQEGNHDSGFNGVVFMHSNVPYEIDNLPVFTLNAANQLAAWGVVSSNGSGGVSLSVNKGLSSVTIDASPPGGFIRVTFGGTLPSTNYAVFLQNQEGGDLLIPIVRDKTETHFDFDALTWVGPPTSDWSSVNWLNEVHRIAVAVTYRF